MGLMECDKPDIIFQRKFLKAVKTNFNGDEWVLILLAGPGRLTGNLLAKNLQRIDLNDIKDRSIGQN